MTSKLHRRDDDDERGDISDEQRAIGIERMKADLAIHKTPALGELEGRLYKHVLDCIDFDALFGLEQMLWHVVDQLGHSRLEDETSLSRRLIERAITRAAHDPSTRFTDIPYGITPAEMRAARFDPACPFCQYEDEIGRAGGDSNDGDDDEDGGGHDHEGDACPLCDDMAKEWRAKHAAQLRRAGLA